MQFKKLLFFIISITITLTSCESKNEENTTEKKLEQKEKTSFILTTQNATTLTLKIENEKLKVKELENKAILINFWATWCPPCKAEIPHLISLQNKYKGKLEILALNVGDTNGSLSNNEKINEFIKEYKINYLVTNVEDNFKVADALGGVKIIPTMYLFDKQGNKIQKYVGVVPEEMLETDIKKALGE